MEKIDSNITLPPIRPGTDNPNIVMTGKRAFRSACFLMTMRSGNPLARAVVIYSCLNTSRRLLFM